MNRRRSGSVLVGTALWWGIGLAPGCSGGRAGGPATGDASVTGADGAPDAAVAGLDASEGEAAIGADSRVPGAGDDAPAVAGTSDACTAPSTDVGIRNGVRLLLDLVVTGQGFEEHEGKRVYVFTRESNYRTPLGHGSELVRSGRFTLRFPDGYARFSYQLVFYYVDVNGDGRCDESTGDHTGFTITNAFNPAGNEPDEVALPDNHRSSQRDERVCDLMNACH
jgi:hypothetical protein